MRPLTPVLFAAALAAGFPVRAFAQTAKPADLIGAWALQGETKIRFNFQADSTVTLPVPLQRGQERIEGTGKGRWRLAGDTLIIDQVRTKMMNQFVSVKYSVDPRLVKFKDSLLTLTQLTLTLPNGTQDTSAAAKASSVRVYHRVEQDTQPATPAQPAAKP